MTATSLADISSPMPLSRNHRRQSDPPMSAFSHRSTILKSSTTDPPYRSRHVSTPRRLTAGHSVGRFSNPIFESTRHDTALPRPMVLQSQTIPELELEFGFPDLHWKGESIGHALCAAATVDDLTTLHALAEDFAHALWNQTCLLVDLFLLHDRLSSAKSIRTHSPLSKAVDDVALACNVFEIQITKKASVSTEDDLQYFTEMVFGCLDVAIDSFNCVLQSLKRLRNDSKPLPLLPIEDLAADAGRPQSGYGAPDDDSTSFSHDGFSMDSGSLNSTNWQRGATKRFKIGVARAIERAKSFTAASLHSSSFDSTVTLVEPDSPVVETGTQCNANLLRMLQRVVRTPLHSLSPKPTIMEPDPLILDLPQKVPKPPEPEGSDSFKLVLREKRTPEPRIPHERASVIFYEDPAQPGVGLGMPIPVDAFDVAYNDDGDMVAASLSSLIRSVTSKDAILDKDIKEVFFLMFRQFASPIELYQKLVERYDEGPPCALTEAQETGWEALLKTRRIRVTRVFFEWVNLHWKPETDAEALPLIRNFTHERIAIDVGGALPQKLNDALLRCSAGGLLYSGRRAKEYFDKQNEICRPTGFKRKWMKLEDYDLSKVDILEFQGEVGCEELARQLTLKASKVFEELDTTEVVNCWRREKFAPIQTKLNGWEEATCLWAEAAILQKSTSKGRAQVLDILYDVAIICLGWRNFSTAFAIHAAIAGASIYRLKGTFHEVSPSHREQHHQLNTFFCNYTNSCLYRAMYTSSDKPIVPLMHVHFKDISSAFYASKRKKIVDDKVLLNLHPYRIAAQTRRDMENWRKAYKFQLVKPVQSWLDEHIDYFLDGKETTDISVQLYDRSLQLEPRSLNIAAPAWLEPRSKQPEGLERPEATGVPRRRARPSMIMEMIKTLRRPPAPRAA